MFPESVLDVECVSLGIDPFKRDILVKVASEQRSTYTSSDIRLAAAIAKTAFELSDDRGHLGHRLYSAMLLQPEATDGHRKLASIVFTSLGLVVRDQHEKLAAGGLLGSLTSGKALGGALFSAVPEALKGLSYAGMALGGTAGAGVWGINRLLNKDDDKLRELEIQRDTYSRLTAQIKQELARRKLKDTPDNVAAAVDYIT